MFLPRSLNRAFEATVTSYSSCELAYQKLFVPTGCSFGQFKTLGRCCPRISPSKIRSLGTTPSRLSNRPKWRFKAVANPPSRNGGSENPFADESQSETVRSGNRATGANPLRKSFGYVANSAQGVFDASQAASTRLREASQYMQDKYDAIRARKGLWRIQDGSDWSIDWEIPMDMLKLEFQRGQYVRLATSGSQTQLRGDTSQERWRRRISRRLSTTRSLWDQMGPAEPSTEAFKEYVRQIVTLEALRPLQRNLYRPDNPNAFNSSYEHQVRIQLKLE